MSYQRFDHAGWMQSHIDCQRQHKRKMHHTTPEKLSAFQCNVVDILGMVGGGIYNAPINPDKIDWNYGRGVSVIWQNHELATFDSMGLTMLVFLCHEARIRCSVSSVGPRLLRLSFWQRQESGDFCRRHPNIEEAVKLFRAYLPDDHRIIFRQAPAEQPQETVTVGGAPEESEPRSTNL